MTSSLVGSEMCIRDRQLRYQKELEQDCEDGYIPKRMDCPVCQEASGPVSYTHLTLPTICSV
eukprot:11730916-Prorocentrum_lima.AAC.1